MYTITNVVQVAARLYWPTKEKKRYGVYTIIDAMHVFGLVF